MKKLLFAFAVAVVLGCGPEDYAPSWAGTYVGSVTATSTTCSNGQSVSPFTVDASPVLMANGFNRVSFDAASDCPVPMNVDATSGTLLRTTCPGVVTTTTSSGTTLSYTTTYISGSLTLTAPRLSGPMSLSFSYSNGVTCTTSLSLSATR